MLLALVSVFSLFTPAVYGASGDYDASAPSSSHNLTVDTAALLEGALGEELTEAEREYLSLHGELKLHYNAAIPTRLITTEYIDTTLKVQALPYTYGAKNGSEVVWTPNSVTLSGVTRELLSEGEAYSAVFTGVAEEDGLSVSVSYLASFIIKKEDVNSVINTAS